MNEELNWKLADIQRVNNFLIIKGETLLNASVDPYRITRACYELPSNPDKLDIWVKKHFNDNEAKKLYNLVFS